MTSRSLLPFLIFATITLTAPSQDISEHLCDPIDFPSSDSNKLFLSIEDINFVKNNEYFNQISEGSTMIGYGLSPLLSYQISPKARIRAGAYLLMYFGRPGYSAIAPVLSFEYRINRNIDFIFGTIHGTVNHRVIEPMYSFDRYYTNHIENGLQWLIHSGRVRGDFWLNWQRFIFPEDHFTEAFSIGASFRFNLLKPGGSWQFYIPLQVTMYHEGGQVNETETANLSVLNSAEGLGTEYRPSGSFFSRIALDACFVTYDKFGNRSMPYNDGLGIYTYATGESRFGTLVLGYWNADRYYAPLGESLFHSFSLTNHNDPICHREVIFGKIIYHRFLTRSKSICLDLRFEGYYFPQLCQLDYSYGLCVTVKPGFFLKKINPRKDLP